MLSMLSGVDGWMMRRFLAGELMDGGGWAFDHPVGAITDGDGAIAGSVGKRLRMS